MAGKVIVEALKKAGPNPMREKVLHSPGNFTNADLGGFRMNFGPKSCSESNYVDISILSKDGRVLR